MSKYRKSKTNTTFFMDIPKESSEDRNQMLLEKCQALSRYVKERTEIADKIREDRKRLYNLSQEIHEIEQEIAGMQL